MSRAAIFLLAVGLLQMTGDLLGVPRLQRLGAATGASPAPQVFFAVRGLETDSTRFYLEWDDPAGRPFSLELTPELYARLRGPCNRRNAYGAAVACGPVLSRDQPRMHAAVMRYALTGDAPLLRELGIEPSDRGGPVRVRYEPRPGTDRGDLPRVLEAP